MYCAAPDDAVPFNALAPGSLDYTIRIYDFNGMKSDLRAFRCATPPAAAACTLGALSHACMQTSPGRCCCCCCTCGTPRGSAPAVRHSCWPRDAAPHPPALCVRRELEPQEGHPVLSVSWSPSGDAFMVVTGSSKVGALVVVGGGNCTGLLHAAAPAMRGPRAPAHGSPGAPAPRRPSCLTATAWRWASLCAATCTSATSATPRAT